VHPSSREAADCHMNAPWSQAMDLPVCDDICDRQNCSRPGWLSTCSEAGKRGDPAGRQAASRKTRWVSVMSCWYPECARLDGPASASPGPKELLLTAFAGAHHTSLPPFAQSICCCSAKATHAAHILTALLKPQIQGKDVCTIRNRALRRVCASSRSVLL